MEAQARGQRQYRTSERTSTAIGGQPGQEGNWLQRLLGRAQQAWTPTYTNTGLTVPQWLANVFSRVQGVGGGFSQAWSGFPELRGDIGRAAEQTTTGPGTGEAGIGGAFNFLGNLLGQIQTPQQGQYTGPNWLQSLGLGGGAGQAGGFNQALYEQTRRELNPDWYPGMPEPWGHGPADQAAAMAASQLSSYYPVLGDLAPPYDAGFDFGDGGGGGGGGGFTPEDQGWWLRLPRWLIT